MLKYFFNSILFTLFLFFTSCHTDPYFLKKDNNVLVVKCNGVTTRNPVVVSTSGRLNPDFSMYANGFPYSIGFYLPSSGDVIIVYMNLKIGKTPLKSFTPTKPGSATYKVDLLGNVSISASFTNLMFVADSLTGSPTDTIYVSTDIYGAD